jgi:hypothetical protein
MGMRSANIRLATTCARWLVAAVIVVAALDAAGAQGAPGLLTGDVVASETGTPLGHSMVTVLGLARQTFTSETGVFAIGALGPGRYRLRVTHIGFTPVESIVDVPDGVPPQRLRIQLTRITVQLGTVRVIAGNPTCTRPGPPGPEVDSTFASIINQLRLNAEHFQLLSDSFPFKYKVEHTFHSMRADSSKVDPRKETVAFRSDLHGWAYRIGEVIEVTRDGKTLMHLPTLRDFASYDFLNNHCFRYAGVDYTDAGPLVHISFAADVQIKNPDVNGDVYLDAKTYQIQRAELQLTKIPSGIPLVTAVRVTTIFGEISPAIVVVRDVHGITSLAHSPTSTAIAMTEDQHSFAFEWLRDDPAHPFVRP